MTYGWIRSTLSRAELAMAEVRGAKVITAAENRMAGTLVQVGVIVKDGNLDADAVALDIAIEGLYPFDFGDHFRIFDVAKAA
jgi:hypothetical protein